MIKIPKNGHYLSRDDFGQWQDEFSKAYTSYQKCTGCDSNCLIEDESSCSVGSNLKVKNITFVVTERCNLNCSYCLSGDTLISMSDFTKKYISDIQIGDQILAFNEDIKSTIGEITDAIVENIFHRKAKVIQIIFEDKDKLSITKNHRILTKVDNKFEYIEAGQFKVGDSVYYEDNIELKNGDSFVYIFDKKITAIFEEEEEVDVYNLSTSTRTYIANNILVHNCYEQHKTGKIMTKEIGKAAVDFLFDEKRVNGYFDPITSPGCILEFIGGEPLLEIELMDYIVEYFKRKAFEIDSPWATNYMINMTSNGTLFQTPKVQEFLQKNLGKVSIGITIDGNKRLHDACRLFHDGKGSYDIVEASVKQAIKDGYMDSTKITLSHENIMYLNEAMQNIWSLGLSGSHTNCVFEDVWNIEDAKILYSQMKELGDYLLKDKNYSRYYCSLFDDYIGEKLVDDQNFCGGNGEMLAIGTDGKCYPCIRFMQYSLNNQQEKCIGNIYDGLDNKDENEWLKELKAITMTSQCQYEDNKKCLDCKIATGCALCTGYNYDTFGTPNHKATFICDMHKARVLANCYYWNKLKKEVPIVDTFKLNLDKEECLKIIDEDEYNFLLSLIGDN